MNEGFPHYAKDLFNDPSLCDVTIVVDNDEQAPNCDETVSVQAHRVVLATMSDYFRTMLYGQFIEANQKEVRLHGVSHSTFQLCLRFMYRGWDTTLDGMSFYESIKFYSLARMLLMDGKLKASYSRWIEGNIVKWEKQIWTILAMAVDYEFPLLMSRCMKYVIEFANEYLFFEEFNKVPLAVVRKVLEYDEFNCTKRELQEAIKCWIASNQIEEHVKINLLESVRSKKAPLFTSLKVLLYKSFKVHSQQKQTSSSSEDPTEYSYSSSLLFCKCAFLLGVTVVLERKSGLRHLAKGRIDLDVAIFDGCDQIMARTAYLTYDLTNCVERPVNIFFPDVKCCREKSYVFKFSWKSETVQPVVMRLYGPTRNKSGNVATSFKSYVVGIFYNLASIDGDSDCESCQMGSDSSVYF